MIYTFDTKKRLQLNQVGGKAKALIETTNAGFPVPGGFVLSVEFFDCWLSTIKATDIWKQFKISMTKENCNRVKAYAESMIFTATQREMFNQYMDGLAGDVFAVRSSSPEEDLEGTSFAGMYETFLGVTRENIEHSVAMAFSSCFDYRVMAYKDQQNIDLQNTAIAVVIQKQIASDVSGVGFSINPLNNCYDEVMINASFGLGEAIVSGIVTPDTYVVDFVEDSIIEKQINHKEAVINLKPDGGCVEEVNEYPEKQALLDEQILSLARLIKKCEVHYGQPMDTEWAFEDGILFLLQSRPITTHFPLFDELVTKPGEAKCLYFDHNILTQGLSESFSVLGTDTLKDVIHETKGAFLNTDIDGTQPVLHGRSYVNASYFYKGLGNRFFTRMVNDYDENMNSILRSIDMTEYTSVKIPSKLKGLKGKIVKMSLQNLPSLAKPFFRGHQQVIEDYNFNKNMLVNQDVRFEQDMDFEGAVTKLTGQFGLVTKSVSLMFVGMIALGKVKKMFKEDGLENEVIALGMDLDGNPTSEIGHMMYKLASYDELQDTKSRSEFMEKIAHRTYTPEFMKDFDFYLKYYGCRCFKEIDVASKRSGEDIGTIYDALKEINIQVNQIESVKLRRSEAYATLLTLATKKGFKKKFVKQAKIIQATYGYKELPKYIMVLTMGQLHGLYLEAGKYFVEQGRLTYPYQVFDLHKSEVMLAMKDKTVDLHTLRKCNLEPYQKLDHIKEWPLVFDSRGKIFKPKLKVSDGDYVGTAISPGVIRGRAKVLHEPYEKPIEPGEILIARATEPSWTPIFINAAAVVMEIGGPLQHGAIISREYGIPCVSGLMGIMEIIQDGDLIEVDGSHGVVRMIEQSNK